MISSKPLDQVTEADLQDLITFRVAERKTLDYKRDLPRASSADRDKFLANASSFANTSGGDLVFGVNAPSGTGEPTSIPGLDLPRPEDEKLRLEQFLQSGLRPALPRHDMRYFQLSSGRFVLILRIWQSWIGPHRVGEHGPFYARNSAGKYQLDVGQLRQAFGLSESISQRMGAFRVERIARVYADELPALVEEGPRLHIMIATPSAFVPFPELDVADAMNRAFADRGDNFGHQAFAPFSHTGSWGQFINLEGRVVVPTTAGGQPAGRSYIQIHRSGILETLWLLPRSDVEYNRQIIRLIPGDGWVPNLLQLLPSYIAGLVRLGVPLPFFAAFSFLSVKGLRLAGPQYSHTTRAFDRDQVVLPDIYFESAPTDIRPLIKRSLDMLWNAVGEEQNPYVT
ncbi:MAG: helix-turn-helix domain-containing protein [Candidatus Binatales bacterium]